MSDRKALESVVDELEARIKAAPQDENLPPLLALALKELSAFDEATAAAAAAAPAPAPEAASDTPHANVQAGGVARVAVPAVAPEVSEAPDPAPAPAPAPAASRRLGAAVAIKPWRGGNVKVDFDPHKD